MTVPAVVAELDFQPVMVLRAACTIVEAARAFATSDSGVALVATAPIAEITEHDIAMLVAEAVPVGTALGNLELRPPCLVAPSTTVEDAMAMMIVTGRRAAVVADDEQPLGVVLLADAIAALLSSSTWVGALRLALHIEGGL
jgi:signal-transduction protein with cAMP-binding, CBS, and nucleotidyltransferase domain